MKQDTTTIRLRKTTAELLKAVAKRRDRRETMEQVILELVDQYVRKMNA